MCAAVHLIVSASLPAWEGRIEINLLIPARKRGQKLIILKKERADASALSLFQFTSPVGNDCIRDLFLINFVTVNEWNVS